MKRVSYLISGQPAARHDPVVPDSVYEKTYSNVIEEHAHILFPNYRCVTFSPSIYSDSYNTTNKPDLALLDQNLDRWYVVEVELPGHPIHHVVEQINTFRTGDYRDQAELLHKKFKKHFALNKLKNLVNDSQPEVIVVSPKVRDEWTEECPQDEVIFIEFEIFRDSESRSLYRVQDIRGRVEPSEPREFIGTIQYGNAPNTYIYQGDAKHIDFNRPVQFSLNDQVFELRAFEENGKIILSPLERARPFLHKDDCPFRISGNKASKPYELKPDKKLHS